MGQRTQVLVIKEANDGKRSVNFYYNQWGIGRIMYLGAMDLIMQSYNRDVYDREYSFLKPEKFTDTSFTMITKAVPTKVLHDVNIDDFATIAHVFDFADNNNGGMVVYIKEGRVIYDKYTDKESIKIGFLLGDEDADDFPSEKAFSRWLSPAEYGKMNGGRRTSDEKFVSIFEDFCNYFNVDLLFNNKTTPEENIARLEQLREEYDQYEASLGDEEVPYGD